MKTNNEGLRDKFATYHCKEDDQKYRPLSVSFLLCTSGFSQTSWLIYQGIHLCLFCTLVQTDRLLFLQSCVKRENQVVCPTQLALCQPAMAFAPSVRYTAEHIQCPACSILCTKERRCPACVASLCTCTEKKRALCWNQ